MADRQARHGKYQLAPHMRAYALRCFEILEEKYNLTVPELLAKKVAEDGDILPVLTVLAKYVERDAKIEVTTVNDWVESLRSIGTQESTEDVAGESDSVRH